MKGEPKRDWNKWVDLCLCNQLRNVYWNLWKVSASCILCQAIFGFCDIRNFTDATEVLQEGKRAEASSGKQMQAPPNFILGSVNIFVISSVGKTLDKCSRANRLSTLPFEWPECLPAAASTRIRWWSLWTASHLWFIRASMNSLGIPTRTSVQS